jgi:dipeptidyl aminopeptidase/acylaminoacyl peptidase
LYTVSTYSFEAHKKSKEIRILDLSNSQSTLVTKEEKTSEPHWLEDDVLWLKEGQKGATELIVANGGDLGSTYTAAVIPGPVSDAKLKPLGIGKIAVVFTGKSTPEGDLFNPENEPKKLSSGLVYDSLMVRHWDEYVTPNRNALWYGLFQRSQPHITESKGRWSLSPLINALKGTHLESPIPPFPGTGHYDISSTGIAFVAKDPAIDPAFNTRCDFYFLPVSSFTTASSSQPQKANVEGLEGAASSPVFSPNSRSAAFLKMKRNGYESDKNRLIMIPDVDKLSAATEVLKSNDGAGLWDRSPSSFIWSNDGQSLYLVAEEKGKELLFEVDVPATPLDMNKIPEKITNSGSVSDVQTLGNSRHLFISSSNLIDNSVYSTLDPDHLSSLKQISSSSRNGTSFGLSPDQVFDIWFDGSGDYKVHAWVVRPSHFDDSKKYPLAYVIHGGPQGSWNEQWSTRWNPAVFAEQGYVVVTPNPTGSTGYGQAFTDAIQGNWGGAPYEDLVKGLKYIKAHMPYVDTSRSVALGASYGGYMINWIQGHPLGREFRALVCHDGVFSMANQMSSDEQYFPNHDLGGPFWRNQSDWEKWDPARHTGEWKTPQLIIHSALDYRLPITEGLAAFNVLQERGVESRFLTFPDENHWVLKEENSLVWHTVVLNWINKYVGLPPYKGDGQEGFEMQSRPILGRESGLVRR